MCLYLGLNQQGEILIEGVIKIFIMKKKSIVKIKTVNGCKHFIGEKSKESMEYWMRTGKIKRVFYD